MELPKLENQSLSLLLSLAGRPGQIGEINLRAARVLVDNGLAIRYQTIMLITPLGLVHLQKRPLRWMWRGGVDFFKRLLESGRRPGRRPHALPEGEFARRYN